MSRMLHRSGAPATGQKVFLAVAAYDGLGAGFAYALFHTGAALAEAGIEYELAIYSGNCHVDDSRNRLVRDFLRSDCTDYVSLDADVGWYAKDLLALIGYDRDIVAGVYPKKHGDDTYPVRLLPGEIWSDRDGLIEVQGVPTGFLRIRRQVLQRLADEATHYNAKGESGSGIPCIFERQIHEGTRWGGDYVFCRKARATGFKVYVDPRMRFEHAGEHVWIGSLGAWLKQRAGLGLHEPLAAFRAGTPTAQDAYDAFEAWDNPYAAEPTLLVALCMTARATTGPVLEFGCGLSSLILAASVPDREVHVVESDPIYLSQVREAAQKHGLTNIVPHLCDTASGWYDMKDVPRLDWGLIFVDGPRRSTGGRVSVFERYDVSRAVVIADDVQADGGVPAMRANLERTHIVEQCGTSRRGFAIGVPKPRFAVAAE